MQKTYLIFLLYLVKYSDATESKNKECGHISDGSEDVIYLPSKKIYPPIAPTIHMDFINQPSITLLPPIRDNEIHTIVDTNPLLAALLLSSTLGIPQKSPGFNHPQHLPINPYVALLLSHYGRYLPLYGTARGIYGYTAANNYHNNKPFGSYKIYEDRDN